MYRVRLTYTKSKEAIFIPEKEMLHVMETALVRTGIYVSYNKYNIPNIVFAENVMFGIESTCEICDITITEHVEISYIIKGINNNLPCGMVVLMAEYLNEIDKPINEACLAITYEIIPDFGDVTKLTNREYEDKVKRYRMDMEEYLSLDKILVLVKTMDRSERLDIKEAILSYDININNALRVTISKNTEYTFNPCYIMDGFDEFTNEHTSYFIKKTKTIY